MTPLMWFVAGAIAFGGPATVISSLVIGKQARRIRSLKMAAQIGGR